ncbi:MAG: hypothetical protein IM613_17490, partial [Cytophagales bacterium]|nr:hypothetical protein [Cytophagales bacterium]
MKQNKHTKLVRLFLSIIVTMILCLPSSSYSQQTARVSSGGTGYLEYLPADYASNPTKKYPLLIFLHGSGETGSGSPADLEKVKANGPPKLINQGSNMCFTVNGTTECFLVISPQLSPSAGGWWPSILQPFFEYILNGPMNYRIDKTRVYLTGLSLGGQGVYIGLGETTDVFAAGAVIAGFDNGNGCTISSRKTAVWGFHGESDGTITYSRGQSAFNNIVNCTNPSPTAELKWTSYPNVGHNAWDNAYRTDNSLHTPNLYQWLLSKTKIPGNAAPTANAGADISLILPVNSTSITGSGADSDGNISSFSWSQISGPSVATLSGQTTQNLNASNLIGGNYIF